jgi:hypothetical protein
MCYDSQNDIFYGVEAMLNKPILETFIVSGFKVGGADFGFAKQYLSKRMGQFKTQAFGEE